MADLGVTFRFSMEGVNITSTVGSEYALIGEGDGLWVFDGRQAGVGRLRAEAAAVFRGAVGEGEGFGRSGFRGSRLPNEYRRAKVVLAFVPSSRRQRGDAPQTCRRDGGNGKVAVCGCGCDARCGVRGYGAGDDAQSLPEGVARPDDASMFHRRRALALAFAWAGGTQDPRPKLASGVRGVLVRVCVRVWASAHDRVPDRGARPQRVVCEDDLQTGRVVGVVVEVVHVDDEGRPSVVLEHLDDADRGQPAQGVALSGVGRGGAGHAGALGGAAAGQARGRGRTEPAEGAAGHGEGADAAFLARSAEHPRGSRGAGEARGQLGARGARGEEERRERRAVVEGGGGAGEVEGAQRVAAAGVQAAAFAQRLACRRACRGGGCGRGRTILGRRSLPARNRRRRLRRARRSVSAAAAQGQVGASPSRVGARAVFRRRAGVPWGRVGGRGVVVAVAVEVGRGAGVCWRGRVAACEDGPRLEHGVAARRSQTGSTPSSLQERSTAATAATGQSARPHGRGGGRARASERLAGEVEA